MIDPKVTAFSKSGKRRLNTLLRKTVSLFSDNTITALLNLLNKSNFPIDNIILHTIVI